MPLGAFRINAISKIIMTAAAEVIRGKKSIQAIGNAQVSTAQSQFGGSSYLGDGLGDYLSIDNSSGQFTFGTNDFTIEFWVRLTSMTPTTQILYDGRVAGAYTSIVPVIYIEQVSGQPTLKYYAGADRITYTMSLTTWYHVAVSRSSGSTRMFVNGTQVGSTYSDSNNYICDSKLYLGAHKAFGPGTYDLNGHMDEIRISNTARYTANFTSSTTPFVNDDNTILLVHCNGTNASTFFEDDNGVRTSVGLRGGGNVQIDTAQSKFGGSSILFDGTGDFIIAADNSLLYWNTQPYTVEFWCRINALTTQANDDPVIIGNMRSDGQEDYWSFGPDNSGNLTFKYYNGGNVTVKDTGTMSTATWYHCAAVIASNTIKIYLNGTQVGSAAISGTPQFSTAYGGLNIGWGNGTGSYNGWLDEIRISNIARYTAAFTPSTTPFTNDSNTMLLIHGDGTDATTVLRDDNGSRNQKGIQAIGNAQISTAQSKFGGSSALFDGTGDRLDVKNWSGSITDFTIECWVRHGAVSTVHNNVITSYVPAFNVDGNWAFRTRLSSTTGVSFTFRGNTWYDFQTSFSTADNSWHHIAVVHNNSADTLKIYVDGVERGSWSFTFGGISINADTVFVGGRVDGADSAEAFFNGNIDEVRISNIARYTAAFTPSTTPFANDANTLLLIHADGNDASTVFFDDNGKQTYTPT